MGLFFKKKKLEVPLPPSGELLRFPKLSRMERTIEPNSPPFKIKETPEFEHEPFSLPEISEISEREPGFSQIQTKNFLVPQKPIFLRIQRYQEMIKNLDQVKNRSDDMELTTKSLEKSRFNENKDYELLKNNLKKIHDQLLFMDDLIFKK